MAPITIPLGDVIGPLPDWSTNVVDPLEAWRERCDGARSRPLDCGHFLPEEAPEETLQEILSFLVED